MMFVRNGCKPFSDLRNFSVSGAEPE